MKTNTNQIPNELLFFDYKGISLVHDDIEKIASMIQPDDIVNPDGVISGNLIRMRWMDDNGEDAWCLYSFSDEIYDFLQNTFFSNKTTDDEKEALAKESQEIMQLARDLIGPRIEGIASMEYCSPDVCIHDDGGWGYSS
jgi:hypothetical protein